MFYTDTLTSNLIFFHNMNTQIFGIINWAYHGAYLFLGFVHLINTFSNLYNQVIFTNELQTIYVLLGSKILKYYLRNFDDISLFF